MSKKQQGPDKWKSDEQRSARKQRLQELKTADGGKKKIRKTMSWKSIVSIVIVIAAILGVTALVMLNNGWRETRASAALVNGEYNITPLEANYVLGSQFNSYFRAAAFNADGRQMLTSAMPSPEGFVILRDQLLEGFVEQMESTYALYDLALQSGMSISEEDNVAFERFRQQVEMAAGQQQMNPNDLMRQLFGPGATFNNLKPIMQRHSLAARYQLETMDSYDISDEQLEEEYASNKQIYDAVSFRAFNINLATPERVAEDEPEKESSETTEEETAEEKEETAEEQQARLEAEAQAKAEAMAKAIKSEEDFQKEALAYSTPEQKEVLEDPNATLVARASYQDLNPQYADWLFDEARQTGDVTSISMEGMHTVLYFVSRSRDEAAPYSSRHILIKDASDDEQGKKEAEEKIQSILKEYQAGEQTEDNFAELAKKYSEDEGSKEVGGLYTDVQPSRFTKPYEEWCLDPARTAGEVGIVRVEEPYSGYHLIYFKSLGEANWRTKATQAVQTATFNAELEKMKENFSFEPDAEVMKLILPYDENAASSVSESIRELQESVAADQAAADPVEGQVTVTEVEANEADISDAVESEATTAD